MPLPTLILLPPSFRALELDDTTLKDLYRTVSKYGVRLLHRVRFVSGWMIILEHELFAHASHREHGKRLVTTRSRIFCCRLKCSRQG